MLPSLKGLLAVLVGLCAGALWAQFTITADNLGTPGAGIIEHLEVDTTITGAGPAGADQVWTVPAFEWESYTQWETMLPAATPFAADFPTATMAMHVHEVQDGGGIIECWQFCRVATDGFYFQGLGFLIDGTPVAQPWDPEHLWLPLPLTYGDAWTTVTVTPDGPDATERDSTRHVIDGWGTVHTPFGSCPVLRKFSESWRQRITSDGTTYSEDANYSWLNQQGTPVVEYESNEDSRRPDFTSASVRLMGWPMSSEAGRGPVAERFTVGPNYPNPFNPQTMLPVTLRQAGRVTLDVYDTIGRHVWNGTYELPAGRHSLPIHGAGWGSGTYFVQVRTGSEQQTARILLVK